MVRDLALSRPAWSRRDGISYLALECSASERHSDGRLAKAFVFEALSKLGTVTHRASLCQFESALEQGLLRHGVRVLPPAPQKAESPATIEGKRRALYTSGLFPA